jgi:hypothetical protein
MGRRQINSPSSALREREKLSKKSEKISSNFQTFKRIRPQKLRLIIVPAKGWKGSNIWEQL